MFFKRDLVIVLVALAVASLIGGCSAAMKESGGDQTSAAEVQEQISQVLNCVCHAQYGEWLESRHADLNNSPNRDSCVPCHTGYDSLGQYITPEPKYFVDCASCHEEDGTKHGAINAGLKGDDVFVVCTVCHGLDPIEGDHHGISEYRYWENEEGDDVGGEKNGPSMALTTIAGYEFEVWSLPDSSDWALTDVYHDEVIELDPYSGPYYFHGDRTILDSHFNQIWITNEADKVTVYTTPYARLGYVDLDNNSPNSGLVNADDGENACLASCHSAHTFDKTVQDQWAAGAHRPTPLGPVLDAGGEPFPTSPVNWGAVEHDFGAACLRCHSAAGFAELDGAFGDADETFAAFGEAGAFLTCNSCHDGENYPTRFNARLRLNGDAVIFEFDGSGAILTIEDAGPSATCIYCHQGRKTGDYIKDNYDVAVDPAQEGVALKDDDFGAANSHYVAAGGILWTTVGYEFGDSPTRYTNVSYFAHDKIGIDNEEDTGNGGPCVTCHMSGTPSSHAFYPIVEDANGNERLPEVCANCHDPAEGHELTLEEVEEEAEAYEEALGIISQELQADGVFYLGSYPYFFNTSAGGFGNRVQSWSSEEQLGAAFNLNLLSNEPGAFAHNRYYAKRLVFDSVDWLDNGTLDGVIGDYSLTYPLGAAWLGTRRP